MVKIEIQFTEKEDVFISDGFDLILSPTYQHKYLHPPPPLHPTAFLSFLALRNGHLMMMCAHPASSQLMLAPCCQFLF